MSERPPSSTPEVEPKSALYIEGAPDAMQLDKIDALRTAEAEYERKLVDEVDDPFDVDGRIAKRAEALKEFDNLIKEHLLANGVAEDDPKFDEYAALLRDYSIDSIPESVWSTGAVDDDGTAHPALKMGAYEKVRDTYGAASATSTPEAAPVDPDKAEPAPAPDEAEKSPDEAEKEPASAPEAESESKDDKPEEEGEKKDEADKSDDTAELPKTPDIKAILDADPAIQAARANVVAARNDLAKLTAKRQSSLFSRKKTVGEYEAAQDRYEDAVMNLTKMEIAAEKTAGLERNEENERLDAAFKLVGHYQDLQRESIDIMKDTKVGKAITWMTSGGIVKRVIKGVAVGAAFGVVGAVATGVTGGAAGTAFAAAGVAAARFSRAYAAFDNRAGRGMEVADASHKLSEFSREVINESNAGDKPTNDSIDRVSLALMDKLDAETAKEQGKRRKSTYKALGMVAIGGGLAELGSVVTDHYGSNGLFGSDNADAKSGGTGSDGSGSGAETGDTGNGGNVEPKEPGTGSGPESWDSRPGVDTTGAETIDSGEGFYQTLQEMNIPAEDRAELLAKVGPELHDMQVDGQPLAYKMPNGEWGIRMTPDGKMPTEALQAISDAHDQMSGTGADATGASADTGSEFSAQTEATPEASTADVDTSGLDNGPADVESLSNTVDQSAIQDVMSKETIYPSDITGNSQLMELSHVSSWYPPDALGQKLGLNMQDWNNLQGYIIDETNNGNKLYSDTFEVSSTGYLHFTGNRIPADTMADILNNVPRDARFGLAA